MSLRTRATNRVPLGHLQSGLPSAVFDDRDAVVVSDEWCVFLDDTLARWAVYIDAHNCRVFVSPDTWATIINDGNAEVAFTEQYLYRKTTGKEYIRTDEGPFATAALIEAQLTGADVPAGKDRLSELREMADGMVLQAASLNASARRGQVELFGVRYATLREQAKQMQAELEQVQAVLDMAGMALLDAST